MKKRFSSLQDAVLSYFASVAVTVLAVSLIHFTLSVYQWPFVLLAIVIPWALLCSPIRVGKRFSFAAAVLSAGALLALLAVNVVNRSLDAHDGQSNYFADRNVLVLVPHQDDELLILAGILDRYADTGEITVAFMTNGDYNGKSANRLSEAIRVLRFAGIPEDHVVFLGYGDRWDTSYQHIYFAPETEIVRSHCGETHTYGIDGKHEPFHSSDYTRANLLSDIRSLITTVLPDTIYCIDSDIHPDHECLSLMFEEVMGQLFAERNDYRPFVFKAFAYDTALYLPIPADWVNIPSSGLVGNLPYVSGNSTCLWKERIRLPISRKASTMNESLSNVQMMAEDYISVRNAVSIHRVLRGDKTVWRRYTDGVQYAASWSVSSGDADRLHDFKLLDMTVLDGYPSPTAGTWVPADTDSKRTVTMSFEQPQILTSIILYDNPAIESNVQNARITFSDGTSIESGALLPSGAATELIFAPKTVDWVSIQILQTEGASCGFAEIEAYAAPHPADRSFVKLMDADENFAYHYDLQEASDATFSLYEYGGLDSGDQAASYDIFATGAVQAEWRDGKIVVSCPVGATGRLTVRSKTSREMWDSIEIMNRPEAERVDPEANFDLDIALRYFYSDVNLYRQSRYYAEMLTRLVSKLDRFKA